VNTTPTFANAQEGASISHKAKGRCSPLQNNGLSAVKLNSPEIL